MSIERFNLFHLVLFDNRSVLFQNRLPSFQPCNKNRADYQRCKKNNHHALVDHIHNFKINFLLRPSLIFFKLLHLMDKVADILFLFNTGRPSPSFPPSIPYQNASQLPFLVIFPLPPHIQPALENQKSRIYESSVTEE